MKEILKILRFACLLSCLAGTMQVSAQSGNLRQFSSRNGLSNSAILSLCQDSQGLLWIGTCDGLNIFDGSTIRLYSPDRPGQYLSGNLINQMLEAEPGVLWIQTNYGLDRLDTHQGTILTFPEFQDKTFLARSPDHQVFVLKDDGCLYAYLESEQRFERMEMPPVQFAHAEALSIDRHQVVRIFTSDGDTRSYRLTAHSNGLPTLSPADPFEYADRLQGAFTDGTSIWFTDRSGTLYEYDTDNRKAYHVADIGLETVRRGSLSSVVQRGDDYYIGFKSGGLLALRYQYDQKSKYRALPVGIGSGIFCLLKDRFQDIVWAGTDGQGLYMCYNDAFSVSHTLLNTPDWQVNHPVRALYCDAAQTLWIGTKGSGILCVDHYDSHADSPSPSRHLTTANTPALTDNSVYCFAPGRPDLLWIGTEEGINYYSYTRRRMERLAATDEAGKPVRYVHALVQPDDSTLWAATVGEGIVRITLHPSLYGQPAVRSVERTLLDHGRMASNYFFTIFQEGDSVLWFGNRGQGAYRLEVQEQTLTPYRFSRPGSNQTVNDVFAIHKNQQGYWMGTGAGLLHVGPDLNRPDSLTPVLRNTVHGILEDDFRNLWVSTNLGLTRLDKENRVQQRYNADNGLEVTEFSDGAFWKDPRNGTLFFGGTNGFVTVRPDTKSSSHYLPPIHLKSLSIFGHECRLDSFLQVLPNQMFLQLAHNQNFFRLDFMAIDYIDGNNLSYAYRLDEAGDQWIELGSTPGVSLSNLSPGRYTLRLKYHNNSTGQEVQSLPILIRIAPPWYSSLPARIFYLLLLLMACAAGTYAAIRRYRLRQKQLIEQMDRQKRDEIYESKLRFFTNITHEFCTPLTLICGPCEKILAYTGSDEHIRRYATMIRQNADRLNGLIQELIEFRRLETGHRVRSVQCIPLSDKLQEIAGAFAEMAENRNMDYRLHIQPDVTWNTDETCFGTIATNLLSNAFKYTPDGGEISVTLAADAKRATLCIANSGKGIARENLSKIFDRYTVLDSVEMNGKNARNGLGLAICQSMANLLEGNISVESTPGERTTFTVSLPQLEPTTADTPQPVAVIQVPVNVPTPENPALPEQAPGSFDNNRQTLLVIDDDPSMLWFVSEMFKEQYNVLSFDNAPDALSALEERLPDLIISDVMMPDTDGLSFARKVKQNKLWSHIPLILLSALHHEDDQVKGIESGADAYVTKPFSVKYLEKLTRRLLQRKMDLKEYYGSIFSSYSVENGTPIHKEDQEFLKQMLDLIEKNIARPDLSVELLSSEMGFSTRQFYRKLKPLTPKSPTDLIKECRINVAERLLLHTNLTVEEVMEQTGFVNRGTFYKLFTQRFGMPPRQYREQQKKEVRGGRDEL